MWLEVLHPYPTSQLSVTRAATFIVVAPVLLVYALIHSNLPNIAKT